MSWRKLLFGIGLALGVPLFLRQVWVVFGAAGQEGLQISWSAWWWAALPLGTVAYFVQMAAWTLITRSLGVSLSLRQAMRGYFISFLPRYIPGTVWGYWSRSEWLKQSCGIDYADSALASVLETLALVLTALSVIGGWFSLHFADLRGLALGAASAGVLAFVWFGLPGLALRFERWRGRKESGRQVRISLQAWVSAVVLYMFLWCLHGGSVYLAGQAILSISSLDLPRAVFATALAWLVGFVVVIVPAGIGVRELTLSTLLSGYFHLSPWQASLVATAFRFMVILAEIEWLLVGLALDAHIRWKNFRQAATTTTTKGGQ